MYTDLTFVVFCSYIHDYTVELQKMATCNCVSLEEVLPIMHYNIPTMHWQRQSELHLQSECGSDPPPPQDQCRSTPDPQVNPNFTFKVSVD